MVSLLAMDSGDIAKYYGMNLDDMNMDADGVYAA